MCRAGALILLVCRLFCLSVLPPFSVVPAGGFARPPSVGLVGRVLCGGPFWLVLAFTGVRFGLFWHFQGSVLACCGLPGGSFLAGVVLPGGPFWSFQGAENTQA